MPLLLPLLFTLFTFGASDTLRVVASYDYPPFTYLDKQGNPAGFSVDLARKVSRQLNRPLEIRLRSWKWALEELSSGRADLILDMVPTSERAHRFVFSHSHSFFSYTWFTRSDLPLLTSDADLVGMRLGVQTGDLMDGQLQLPENSSSVIIRLESVHELLQRLSEGHLDAVIIDRLTGLRLIQEMGLRNLRNNASFGYLRWFGLAARLEDSLLMTRVNLALNKLRSDGTYDSLHSNWFNTQQKSLPILAHNSAFLYTLIVLLTVSLLGLILWLLMRSRKKQPETNNLPINFKQIIDNSPDIIWRIRVLPEPCFEYVSPSSAEILGYAPQEYYDNYALGMRIVHSEDLDIFSQFIQDSSTKSKSTVLRFLNKNGSVIWLEINKQLLWDEQGCVFAIDCFGRDITFRMQSEAQSHELQEKQKRLLTEFERSKGDLVESINSLQNCLQKSEENSRKLQNTLDNLPNLGVMGLHRYANGTTQCLVLSQWIAELLNIPLEKIREDFLNFIAMLDGHGAIESLQKALRLSCENSEKLDIEIPINTADGKTLQLRLCGKPHAPGSDGTVELTLWMQDITQEKRKSQTLARHYEILEVTNRQLQSTHEQLWAMHLKLETSEDRLRTLFDNSPLGLFRCNLNGHLDFVNKSLSRMLGSESPEEIILQSMQKSILWPSADFITQVTHQLQAGSREISLEMNFIKLDGSSCPGKLHLRLEREANNETSSWMEGVLEDLSEQKRTAQALALSEDRYRSFLEVAPIALLLLHNGKILHCNALMENLLGAPLAQIGALNQMLPEEGGGGLALLFNPPGNNNTVLRSSGLLRRYDGCLRELEGASVQVVFEESPCTLLMLLDVTQRNELQRQITNSLRLESLAALSAGISHEIKQPLSAILLTAGMLEFSLQSGKNLDDKELLSRYLGISAEAERIRSCIEHMRELTRSEDMAPPRPIALLGLIQNALSLVMNRLQRHGIDWSQGEIPELPLVLCHPLQLEQALITLLTNLLEALDESGQNPKQISLMVRTQNNRVFLELSANGGWAGTDIAHIFHPQGQRSVPAHRLGLPLMRAFVESWNGTLQANKLPKGGISFIITLLANQPTGATEP